MAVAAAPISDLQAAREGMVSSPPPESSVRQNVVVTMLDEV